MADPRFFEKNSSASLEDLAKTSDSTLLDNSKSDYQIHDVAPLKTAEANTISFFDNIKYKGDLLATKAGACVVHADMAEFVPDSCIAIVSKSPYKSYAKIAQYFYPENNPKANISEHAYIHPDAKIGAGCTIDPGAIIKNNSEIAENCWIESGATIGEGVKLGKGCRIGPNANISHALIGEHVRIYPGVCVGQDGFGFAIDPAGHVKVPQLGRVIIEDHVEIGANTTIDRGAGPDTIIGQGTWIDNLVQIAHNVKIGRGCVIVSQVGIAGSTTIEDFVALGGQVGVAGHLTIGMGARIAAQSGVMRNIPAGEEQMGSPAMPIKDCMRQITTLKRLSKNKK